MKGKMNGGKGKINGGKGKINGGRRKRTFIGHEFDIDDVIWIGDFASGLENAVEFIYDEFFGG